MPARCERLHGRIYPRGGWIVGRASSDDALAICRSPSARVSIHPGRGGSHLLSGRKHMDFGGYHGRHRSRVGFDRGGPWFRDRQGRRTASRRLPSSPWGQSQFAASVELAPKNKRISAVLGYARDHIAEELTLEHLAEAVGMSRRQFSRAFRAQTGTTPARVVERLRADMARGRIETTTEPVERIAEAVGFGDAENMRRAFIRIYGQPPQSIRRAIRG